MCAKDSGAGLPCIFAQIRDTWLKLERENEWFVRTATVMPDHIHLVVRLGEKNSLADVVRLFKGRLAPTLRTAGLHWQPSFHDRRIRATDSVLAMFLYVFLNPYRAELIAPGKVWREYYCCEEDWGWFSELTNASVAFPEWLNDGSLGA